MFFAGEKLLESRILAAFSRLILRSNWAFSRFQESYQRVNLLRFERAAERRHIVPTIDNADDHVVVRQFVCDIGEIRTAATTMTLDEVTIEAGFVVEKLCALEDRSARCSNNFFGKG